MLSLLPGGNSRRGLGFREYLWKRMEIVTLEMQQETLHSHHRRPVLSPFFPEKQKLDPLQRQSGDRGVGHSPQQAPCPYPLRDFEINKSLDHTPGRACSFPRGKIAVFKMKVWSTLASRLLKRPWGSFKHTELAPHPSSITKVLKTKRSWLHKTHPSLKMTKPASAIGIPVFLQKDKKGRYHTHTCFATLKVAEPEGQGDNDLHWTLGWEFYFTSPSTTK